MNSKFQLVAIDLDGTLLDNDFKISLRAKEAIRRVRELGVAVTLCTGRMYASALPYARELDLDLPLVTYQGAVVKRSASGEVLYQRFLPLIYARDVVRRAKERGYAVNVYHDDRLFVEDLNNDAVSYARFARVPVRAVGDLLAFLQEDPIKVLVIKEEARLDELAVECRRDYGSAVYITKSQSNFLEFLHPGATKGRGLAAVAACLGIKREAILAIGDSWNDLEMFSYAGYSVVMGNAPPDVQAKADYITRANFDNGVAEALERLVLETASPGKEG